MKLFPHQSEALKRTEGFDRVAFYHDMGLGKTFTGSEKMYEYGNPVNLIVCQKSKVNDWLNHFKEYYTVYVYDLTKKKDFENFFAHADLFSPRVAVDLKPMLLPKDIFITASPMPLSTAHEDFTLPALQSSWNASQVTLRLSAVSSFAPKR